MHNVHTDPSTGTLLRRHACAQALTERGFPLSAKTLATMATRGGGPPYQKFGRAVLYRWGDALGWAEGRLTAPRRNTSEGSFRRPNEGGRR
jgi:hypothetical protein